MRFLKALNEAFGGMKVPEHLRYIPSKPKEEEKHVQGKRLEPHEVLDYVAKIHGKKEDIEDGDLSDRIYSHPWYELKAVPISKIKNEWAVNKQYAKDLSTKLNDNPIVIYKDLSGYYYTIDGGHRLEAYRLAKKKTIPAYTAEEWVDDKDDDHDFED